MHMLYFEDFQVEDAFDLGPLTVTEEEIIAFAMQFDPQYFHVDPERAKHSIFGGVVASGWHCGALFTRMFVDGLLSRMVSMGSPGLEQVRWIQPVRPDDTLRGRFTVLEARISKSRPAMGILRVSCEMFNQRDELVMTDIGTCYVGRRPGILEEEDV